MGELQNMYIVFIYILEEDVRGHVIFRAHTLKIESCISWQLEGPVSRHPFRG